MDADAFEAALNAELDNQAVASGTPDKARGGKVKKKKAVQLPDENQSQPKRPKVVKEKSSVGPSARPFCYPSANTTLHPDSLFSDSCNHSEFLDRAVATRDKTLVQELGPEAGFRLAVAAGLQLALVAAELGKMFAEERKQRSEMSGKLKELAGAEEQIAGLRAEVERLKVELESKEASLKEKDAAFEAERQALVKQAASYLVKGFERAKFQVSQVHPYASLSMLNVRMKDEDFVWAASEEDEEEGEGDGVEGNGEGGDGIPPPA